MAARLPPDVITMQKAASLSLPVPERERIASRLRRDRPRRRLWFVLAATTVLCWLCPWRIGVVMGESMSPSLHSGQIYVLDTSYYRRNPLRRADVIVFRYKGETMTKRVYAIPGDSLPVVRYHDGSGYDLVPPHQVVRLRSALENLQKRGLYCDRSLVTLPILKGYCFVLGDDASRSYDSRGFGLLPTRQILGKIIMPDAEHLSPIRRG